MITAESSLLGAALQRKREDRPLEPWEQMENETSYAHTFTCCLCHRTRDESLAVEPGRLTCQKCVDAMDDHIHRTGKMVVTKPSAQPRENGSLMKTL